MWRKTDEADKFKIIKKGRTHIIPDVYFDWCGVLIIGANSYINSQVWIETHIHDFEDSDWPDGDKPHTLVIGEQVYIGIRAIVLGGCRFIADGVIVGAGSVVTKDINESWTIWAGNPARKIGERNHIYADFEKWGWE